MLALNRSNLYNRGMGKRRARLSDQVRRAVDACGLSRYRISKQLGIAESTMSRFMSGKGGLSLDNLDAVADLLELNIVTGKRPDKKG
jgi:transcriptional regulator with XRE-family HTH domain